MTPEETKAHLRELFVYDANNKQAILRAATAAGYGLPPEAVAGLARPFPGSQVATNITTNNNPGGLVKAALLGATLLGGGIGGGLLASGLMSPAPRGAEPKVIEKISERVYDFGVKMSLEPKEE